MSYCKSYNCYYDCCDYWGDCPYYSSSCYYYYDYTLNGGAIAGIIIGSLFLCFLVFLIIFFCRRCQQRR